MAVADELSGLRARGRKSHPVDGVVKTTLQQQEQVLASDAAPAFGQGKHPAKRFLQGAVDAFEFLLLTQLDTVLGRLPTSALTVLSRRVTPPLYCTFIGVAALSLEEKLDSLSPAQATDWPAVSRHKILQLSSSLVGGSVVSVMAHHSLSRE